MEDNDVVSSLLSLSSSSSSASLPSQSCTRNTRLRSSDHHHDGTNPSLSSSALISYDDIVGYVAANGYVQEMHPTVSLSSKVWYGDELMWSSIVNLSYGPQAKTRFMYRILTRRTDEVHRMLRAGAKVEQRCGIYRSSTPLIIACIDGVYDIVRLLIQYGASLTTRSIQYRCLNYYDLEPLLSPADYQNLPTTVRADHRLLDYTVQIMFPHFAQKSRFKTTLSTATIATTVNAPTVFLTRGVGSYRMGLPSVSVQSGYIQYGMNPLQALIYGYYYNNSFIPPYYPPFLYHYPPGYNFTGPYMLRSTTSYESRIPPPYPRGYIPILQYCIDNYQPQRMNINDILLAAISMQCYDIAKRAIKLGGHHAYTTLSKDAKTGKTVTTPSTVLHAAYLAKYKPDRGDQAEYIASINHHDAATTDTLTFSTEKIDTYRIDPQMIEIVRLLCLNPAKPRNPVTDKVLLAHHCFIAAAYLGLDDVFTSLLAEDDASSSLYTPLVGDAIDEDTDANKSYDTYELYPYERIGLFACTGLCAIHILLHQNYPSLLRLVFEKNIPLRHDIIHPLSRTVQYIVWNNYEELVRILIEQGGMSVNTLDDDDDAEDEDDDEREEKNNRTVTGSKAINDEENELSDSDDSGRSDNTNLTKERKAGKNGSSVLLFIAALQGYPSMVEHLLHRGANPVGKVSFFNFLEEHFATIRVPRRKNLLNSTLDDNTGDEDDANDSDHAGEDDSDDDNDSVDSDGDGNLASFTPLLGAILGKNVEIFRTLVQYSLVTPPTGTTTMKSITSLPMKKKIRLSSSSSLSSSQSTSRWTIQNPRQFGAYSPLQLACIVKANDIVTELLNHYTYSINQCTCVERTIDTLDTDRYLWEQLFKQNDFPSAPTISWKNNEDQNNQPPFTSVGIRFDTFPWLKPFTEFLYHGSPLALALLSPRVMLKADNTGTSVYTRDQRPLRLYQEYDTSIIGTMTTLVEQLLEAGSNPNQRIDGRPPLLFFLHHPSLLRTFLRYGTDLTVTYKDWNILHYVASQPRPGFEVILELLEYGMDPFQLLPQDTIDNCPFLLRLWYNWLRYLNSECSREYSSSVLEIFFDQWRYMLTIFQRIEVNSYPDLLHRMIAMLFSFEVCSYTSVNPSARYAPPIFHYLFCYLFKRQNLMQSYRETFANFFAPDYPLDSGQYLQDYDTLLKYLKDHREESTILEITAHELTILPDPNYVKDDGTPLLFASLRYPFYIDTLLTIGSNINLRNAEHLSLLVHTLTEHTFTSSQKVRTGFQHKDDNILQVAADGLDRLLHRNLQLFLLYGIDVNYATPQGYTALHYAAAFENTATVQLLLDNGADVQALSSNGVSVWESLLLRDPHLRDTIHQTRVLESFRGFGFAYASTLTPKKYTDNDTFLTGNSSSVPCVYHWFTKPYNVSVISEIIDSLFTAGFTFTDQVFSNHVPIIHTLTNCNYGVPYSLVELLIQKGTVNVYETDNNNFDSTVLMQPRLSIDVFRYLVNLFNGNYDATNTSSSSTLSSSTGAVRNFLNVTDKHGRTALHYWCQRNTLKYIDILLATDNCDCNIVDRDGLSPLMFVFLTMIEETEKEKKIESSTNAGLMVPLVPLVSRFSFGRSNGRAVPEGLKSTADPVPTTVITNTAVRKPSKDDFYAIVQSLCRYGANLEHYRMLDNENRTSDDSSSSSSSSSWPPQQRQSIMDIATRLHEKYPFLLQMLEIYRNASVTDRKTLTVPLPQSSDSSSTNYNENSNTATTEQPRPRFVFRGRNGFSFRNQ